ncbi:MAG: beta-(1-6) glucans synthase [Deltaproteobacteria bacterium]|nr:beta-(1-6) glucans synthase [Deltaproteobacteria bacterium]
MRLGFAGLAVSAMVIAAVWAFLGRPLPMPQSPLAAGEKLYCLSYAPFRGGQTPLDPATRITAAQIEDDLSLLAKVTGCVRTYSTDYGLDQIAGIAARHGLTVLQGLWLSSHPEKNHEQIETAIDLANRYPGTIRAVIVGNEVLLRGEMSAIDLAATIRAVKARVHVPVTYADVWEFWLRNRDVATAADFITIHILPYWEDFPIPARDAAAHVASIRAQIVATFAGKDVIIGEVGWPSAGRMREGALPSPANQARVIQDVLALAAREKFRVNVIEAFDQPWKRALEGTVGGHWGLFDDATRAAKFEWGAAISNHPLWKVQAAGGIVLAMVVFGAALAARRDRAAPLARWLAVSVNAMAGGVLIGWAIANVPIESLGAGGWLRSLALTAAALLAPPMLSAAIMRGTPLPPFERLLGPASARVRDPFALALGAIVMTTMLLAIMIALGLVFDPRYKDFPFAPLTAAALPLLLHSFMVPRPQGRQVLAKFGTAEIASAGVLALSVPYVVLNEGFANWQSLWLCAAFAAVAVSLVRVRDAPD